MYVLVLLDSSETTHVTRVLGVFDSWSDAVTRGYRETKGYGEEDEHGLQEDEYGRFCTSDGDPLYSVHLVEKVS
jgi:hypothetical protein